MTADLLTLERAPFGVTPDPSMVFPSEGFAEARAAIVEALESGMGFIVVTGEVGAGKTTLLRSILADPPAHLKIGVVLNTGLGPDDLLRAVAEDLEIALPPDAGRKQIIGLIEEKLMESFAAGKTTAIFVDEAQHLSDESLELLRMLSNLETETDKLVQIALFGQAELRDRLGRPELRQLRSRVAVHRHMEPLSRAETAAYVRHRLLQAGASNPLIFEESALKVLHRASGGFPRRINLIADLALRWVVEEHRTTVDAATVRRAARRLATLEPSLSIKWAARLPALMTALAWVVLIAAIALFLSRARWSARGPADPGGTLPVAATSTRVPDEARVGALLSRFFRIAGVESPQDAARLERLHPSAVARAAGWHWIVLEPNVSLLRGIGLPTFLFLQRVDGTIVPAIVKPLSRIDSDRVRVTWGEGDEAEMRWSELAIADRPAGVLLPLDAWNGGNLVAGATGPDVRRLQQMLARIGFFDGEPTGKFGAATYRALLAFQKDRGIGEDGVAGPRTFCALYAETANAPAHVVPLATPAP